MQGQIHPEIWFGVHLGVNGTEPRRLWGEGSRLASLGERRKLPQWGPGRIPVRN